MSERERVQRYVEALVAQYGGPGGAETSAQRILRALARLAQDDGTIEARQARLAQAARVGRSTWRKWVAILQETGVLAVVAQIDPDSMASLPNVLFFPALGVPERVRGWVEAEALGALGARLEASGRRLQEALERERLRRA